MAEQTQQKFPTEVILLPSKGLLYPKDHPLSSGEIEIKYMTAKEEDILTNQSYIQKGIVLDKLLEAIIVNKNIKINDLYVGDKNALFVSTRILGYGNDYKVNINGKEETIDLTQIEPKNIDYSILENSNNSFTYQIDKPNTVLTFKLLNGNDDKEIERELKGLKKIYPNTSHELTTRLKYMITSVNGDTEKKTVREFVDNYFLARDARAFRNYVKEISPDLDMSVELDSGEEVQIPIGINFFWPDA